MAGFFSLSWNEVLWRRTCCETAAATEFFLRDKEKCGVVLLG